MFNFKAGIHLLWLCLGLNRAGLSSVSHLKVVWVNNCSFSRLTKYATVLQFTTALLSTNCDNLLLQFTIAW